MDKASAQAAFSLIRTSDSAPVTGSFSWYGNAALIFKPSVALQGGVQYTARVTSDARDLNGNPILNPRTWRFTTGTNSTRGVPTPRRRSRCSAQPGSRPFGSRAYVRKDGFMPDYGIEDSLQHTTMVRSVGRRLVSVAARVRCGSRRRLGIWWRVLTKGGPA